MLHGLNNTAGLYINIEFILFQDFLGPCLFKIGCGKRSCCLTNHNLRERAHLNVWYISAHVTASIQHFSAAYTASQPGWKCGCRTGK